MSALTPHTVYFTDNPYNLEGLSFTSGVARNYKGFFHFCQKDSLAFTNLKPKQGFQWIVVSDCWRKQGIYPMCHS